MPRLARDNAPQAAIHRPPAPAGEAAHRGRHGGAHSAGREARLDAAFLRALAAVRAQWLAALAAEPPGPARHVRAYVRSLCDHALQPRTHPLLLQVLVQPHYQAVWCDFVAEGCAGDSVDHDLSLQCRAAVEGLWFRQAMLHACMQGAQGTAGAAKPAEGAEPGPAEDRALGARTTPSARVTQMATALAVRDYLLSLCDAACATTAPAHAMHRPADLAPH